MMTEALAHYQDYVATLVGTEGPVPDDFIGVTIDEVNGIFAAQRDEMEALLCLSLLSTVEAMFRMDYLARCQARRPRDAVTKKLRQIYRRKGARADLAEDILVAWRQGTTGLSTAISDLKAALLYRHWLAHGRYWVPKLGRQYEFSTIYRICDAVQSTVPLV
jgi:hypothetical protein